MNNNVGVQNVIFASMNETSWITSLACSGTDKEVYWMNANSSSSVASCDLYKGDYDGDLDSVKHLSSGIANPSRALWADHYIFFISGGTTVQRYSLREDEVYTVATGLTGATSLTFIEDYIYVSDSKGISVIPYEDGLYQTPIALSIGSHPNIKGITHFSSAMYIFSSLGLALALLFNMVSL